MPAPVDISDPFRALSDPTRREIVDLLAAGPLPVRLVASHFPSISRPAVSKHLRSLREGGLVVEERQGRERYYSLHRANVAQTLKWMEDVVRRASALKVTKPTKSSEPETPAVSASAPGSGAASQKRRASSPPRKRRPSKPARSRQQMERTRRPEAAKPAERAEKVPDEGTPEPGDWRAW